MQTTAKSPKGHDHIWEKLNRNWSNNISSSSYRLIKAIKTSSEQKNLWQMHVVNAWAFFYPIDLNKGIQKGAGRGRWWRYYIRHSEVCVIITLRWSIIFILIVSDKISLDPITFKTSETLNCLSMYSTDYFNKTVITRSCNESLMMISVYVILVNRGRYELSLTKYIINAQNFTNKSYKHYLQIISI